MQTRPQMTLGRTWITFLSSTSTISLSPVFLCTKLFLKVGTPVLLLRNLDPANGLCNGTRLLITRLGGRVIEGKILTGSCAGNTVFIPRIALTSESHIGLPFILRRVQFPIRLAFGMTINKSQGQSLTLVSILSRRSSLMANSM